MKHFGKEDRFAYKESALFELMQSYGEGALFYSGLGVPDTARLFVAEQYKRFNVPIGHNICALYDYGLALFRAYLDHYDPYMMFCDWSDVQMTTTWSTHTYELLIDGKFQEADPEFIETFAFIPGQAARFFNEYIAKPGGAALPPYIFDSFEAWVDDDIYDQSDMEYVDCEGNRVDGQLLRHEVMMVCMQNGVFNKQMFNAYFDLSMWAGILWLFGPLSTGFRADANEITCQAILNPGQEVVLYEGSVYDSKYYRRIERLPNSCYKCGISGWCVEQTLDEDGIVRHICEGCLSRGKERFDGATCGTKFCRYWECPHNLYYQNSTGAMNSMRTSGQLSKKAEEGRKLILEQPRPLAKILA